MRALILAVLASLFVAQAPTAHANVAVIANVVSSPINVSIIANRTSGAAPLYVHMDASATTSTATTRCFHDCEFQWDFGDPVATSASACGSALAGEGKWACGSNAGANSKNTARGPVAGHIFEQAGTYSVCATITDGTNTVTQGVYSNPPCTTITVTAPDSQWPTNKTICLSTGTATAGVGGCPTGATARSNLTTNITAQVASDIGSGNVRFLLKCGDTFDTATAIVLDKQGPGYFGAYGSCAKPIIRATADNVIFNISSFTFPGDNGGAQFSDWRFVDLVLDGSSGADVVGIQTLGGAKQITALRMEYQNLELGFNFRTGDLLTNVLNQQGAPGHLLYDQIASVDSKYSLPSTGNSYAWIGGADRSFFAGNSFDMNSTGAHAFRNGSGAKVVISNNYIANTGCCQSVDVKIHGPGRLTNSVDHYGMGGGYSRWIVFSDNKVTSGAVNTGGKWLVDFGPQDFLSDELVKDVLVERNWFVSQKYAAIHVVLSNVDEATIRNNVSNFTNADDGQTIRIYSVVTSKTGQVPNQIRIYNHSVYMGTAFLNGFDGVVITDATPTNVTIKNFLSYVPFGTAGTTNNVVNNSGGAAAPTVGGNSTNAQSRNGPNPFTVSSPVNPIDFKPVAGSYAIAGGVAVPVWSDFFLAAEPAPRDIGAVAH